MGRWRPPPPQSSPYISAEGFETLQLELKDRWQKRKSVTEALSAAAAEGDRSENAEYIYRKKELREIDHRIRYLQKRLPNLKVIREQPSDLTRIFFGAQVSLKNDQNTTVQYRIVGPDEITCSGNISLDSPLAKALLRKSTHDTVSISTEYGKKTYTILNITYL